MPEPLDARERRELCDLLGDLGPDAPTGCEGWTTFDLAIHLVVRERLLERGTRRVRARGYRDAVEQVRNGPPLWQSAVPGLRRRLHLEEHRARHAALRRANGFTTDGI